jgi:hypothetical protein
MVQTSSALLIAAVAFNAASTFSAPVITMPNDSAVMPEFHNKHAACSLEEHQFRFLEHLIDELHAEEETLPGARPKGGARWNSNLVKSTAEGPPKKVINQRTSFANATESTASGMAVHSTELAVQRVLEERQFRFLRRLIDELRAEERALDRASPKCGAMRHINAAKPMAQGQPRIGKVMNPLTPAPQLSTVYPVVTV